MRALTLPLTLSLLSLLAVACAGELAYDPAEFQAALGDGGTWPPGADPSGGGNGAPSATVCDPLAVLATSCAGAFCHSPEKPAAGLDLATPGVETRLVGVGSSCGAIPLIDPVSPANSYLLQKLTAIEPLCGVSMPLGRALEADALRCLEQWVHSVAAGGAP